MRIATWNVNSIRQRHDHVVAWLKEHVPDILCLQELKCVTEAFPGEAFEALGYTLAVHGQKGFNGVAILSKAPLEEVATVLPGNDEDTQARLLEVVVSRPSGAIRVVCLYLPNGNPVESDKYPYKLAWMDRLAALARSRLAQEEPFVLAGDYNVIPEPEDVYAPAAWVEDALFRLETRAKFRSLLALGLTDAFRACNDEAGQYSFWDYQAGAWQKNLGLRIDHILLSPQAADRLVTSGIDSSPRDWEKPSDHVPVWVELDL